MEGQHANLDCDGRREKAGEQAERDADAAGWASGMTAQ
jgi:hypothetical protein